MADEEIVEVEDVVDESQLESEAEEELLEDSEGLDSDDSAGESEDDEVIITIGEDSPAPEKEQAPEWVKELRRNYRDAQREKKALEARIKELEAPQQKRVEVGQKPTLEQHDYDAENYEKALAEWYERKRQADDEKKIAEIKAEEEKKAWQDQLNRYAEARSSLKVRDFDEAEAVVLDVLDLTQQGILVQGADDAAKIVYALGTNEEKAKELAKIKDPVKFAFAVAKLETQLKVKGKRTPPPPEKRPSGTAPKSGVVDSTLERLRAEAQKTGDFSKLLEYKRAAKK
ncbi:hypothetical protein [Neptunomonas phycophila]|uniref:hypothetical protein n=1 Tax=Neptunomonas phycophila TaxID=1572645 RepID=UPI0035119724